MNDEQKAFLTELMALFDKYNVGEMYIDDTDGITFLSSGQTLSVQKYVYGEYNRVVTTMESFKPETEGANNGND